MRADEDVNAIDIGPLLDKHRLGRTHIALLGLCTLVMAIDGFDVFLTGNLAPALADFFGRPAAAMTFVFVLQQIGLAAGAFLIGPFADRYGRRRMLLLCTAAFSLMTLAALLARSLEQFAVLRFLAGVVLSGVLPNAIALLSEQTPARVRATFITISFAGFSAGGMAASLFTAVVLPVYGWQAGFWIGGLLPLAILPLLFWQLPESIAYRVGRNGEDPRIGAALKRLMPELELSGLERFTLTRGQRSTESSKPSLKGLFQGRLALATPMIWLCFFFALGNVALLSSWMTSFYNRMGGVPLPQAATMVMIGFAGSFAGMFSVGYLLDRFGHLRVLPAVYFLCAAMIIALGQLPFGTPLFMAAQILWGFSQAAGQAGLNAVAASYYPPYVRATGVGWAFGMGRIGGVIAPMFGGMALAAGYSLGVTFLLISLPACIVGILLFVLFSRKARA
jgi:MFS transporter, AAHS family, 4-hydroxybenzoate transporter